MQEPLRLYLLGGFRLERISVPERDAERVHLYSRKVESLLAYLALFPQEHAREKIAALLWGDSTDEQARGSLRRALNNLRQQLGADALLTDRETVQLNPDFPLWCDAVEFKTQNAEFKIQNYSGELLSDFYDDWIFPLREEYRAHYLDALAHSIEHARAASEYTQAIASAQKILALDRAHEEAHQHLMFCYAALGNRSAALEQYEACRSALREELGVEPSKETRALYASIQKQEETGSRAARLTNLPKPLTSFVGREQQLAELVQLTLTSRLVTLTGAGGSGKTRLAIQIGHQLYEQFADGVWFVDLVPLTDFALVPQQVAKTLGVQEQPQRDVIETLLEFLQEKSLLLILDNCEHLVNACAVLAETLVTQCASLHLLATSREPLGIGGEMVWRVPTLAVPPAQEFTEWLMQYDAVRLFVERARAVNPRFVLDEQNASAVAHICQRLDGIPLAIELAAARANVLSPEQIAARLDDRFGLLTSGSRTALPRQQTLRGLIDWSYGLLEDNERVLLRRLSVFAGGWTLEAAEAVCGSNGLDASDILELLAQLVNKSLVMTEMGGEDTRYRMLETIREYALEKLRGAGNVELVRNHHRDYFLAFAELANRQSFPERIKWQRHLEVEHDNLRAALRWTFEQHESEIALALCNALSVFWNGRGYWTESRIWFEQAIAASRRAQATAPVSQAHLAQYGKALDESGTYAVMQGDHVTGRAKLNEALAVESELGDKKGIASVLKNFGLLAWQQDNLKQAQSYYQESLALSRELDDKMNIASALSSLALVAKEQGEYSTAHALLQESEPFFRELGDKEGVAFALEQRSWLAMIEGDYARSQQFAEESFAANQELDDKFRLAWSLNQKGFLAWHQGNYAVARNSLEQALPIFQKLQASSYNVCLCLTGLAMVDVTEAHFIRGTKLLGAIKAESERTGRHNKDIFLIVYNKALEIAQAQLDAEAFNAAWLEGRAMALEQAIEYALSDET